MDTLTAPAAAAPATTTAVAGQTSFREQTLERRRRLAERTLAQFPNRVPVILVKGPRCIAKTRKDEDFVVVPDSMTMGNLMAILRRRVLVNSTDGFFLYVNGSMPVLSATLASVYAEHKGPDLLLHMVYETQSTFGAP